MVFILTTGKLAGTPCTPFFSSSMLCVFLGDVHKCQFTPGEGTDANSKKGLHPSPVLCTSGFTGGKLQQNGRLTGTCIPPCKAQSSLSSSKNCCCLSPLESCNFQELPEPCEFSSFLGSVHSILSFSFSSLPSPSKMEGFNLKLHRLHHKALF